MVPTTRTLVEENRQDSDQDPEHERELIRYCPDTELDFNQVSKNKI